MVASHIQYGAEVDEARHAAERLEKQVASMQAFSKLPRVSFVIQANSFEDAQNRFQEVENAATAKRAEMMAAKEVNNGK